jgi:hypothetical protein
MSQETKEIMASKLKMMAFLVVVFALMLIVAAGTCAFRPDIAARFPGCTDGSLKEIAIMLFGGVGGLWAAYLMKGKSE